MNPTNTSKTQNVGNTGTGKTVLESVLNPSLTLTFDLTNMLYMGVTIFVAITLSGLVVEGIKKLMR